MIKLPTGSLKVVYVYDEEWCSLASTSCPEVLIYLFYFIKPHAVLPSWMWQCHLHE